MIEAMPSITKNAMRIMVSERTPLDGHNSSTIPTAIPRIAETSDHPKPGAWRIRKVVIKPTIPLMRKSQPYRISTASVEGPKRSPRWHAQRSEWHPDVLYRRQSARRFGKRIERGDRFASSIGSQPAVSGSRVEGKSDRQLSGLPIAQKAQKIDDRHGQFAPTAPSFCGRTPR